ncbi:MAG: hypothetical protein QM697_13340 [Lachnospiraceae bacterium]
MKKMKIGCLVCGDLYTRTQEVFEEGNLDLSDCRKWDIPVEQPLLESIRKRIEPALPVDVDFFFEQITCENEALDAPEADAYIVVPLGTTTAGKKGAEAFDIVFAAIYAKNKPMVFSVLPYQEVWSYGSVYYPYFIRDFRKIDAYMGLDSKYFVSRDIEDLSAKLHAIKVWYQINHTTVLCIGEPMYEPFHSWDWGYGVLREIQEKFGIRWKQMSSDSFIKFFEEWDEKYPVGIAAEEAAGVHLPEGYSTDRAEKMYYIFKELIEQNEADAFTVNCLWSVVHSACKTTSCYSLSRLNDDGIVSACEADVTTLLNMMIVALSSGEPAFMLNPFHFPEDNKLFVSHCTSPRKHSYMGEKQDDYHIYSYYEFPALSCGLQIVKEPGPVTITGISHDTMDEMIVIQGELIRNTAFSSCRTQVEIDVQSDICEIVNSYQGRHWVMVYGDQTKKIKNANDLLKISTKIF